MIFWLNGQLSEEINAIAINDRGFLLGDGLFETFRIENKQPQDLVAHLNRLDQSLKIMGIEIPYQRSEFISAMDQVIQGNAITSGSLRLTISRGVGPRGLLPPKDCKITVMITAVASEVSANRLPAIKLMVSSIRRNDTSPASRMKTIGGYLDNILALQEAKNAGFDDALLLNTKDQVACS